MKRRDFLATTGVITAASILGTGRGHFQNEHVAHAAAPDRYNFLILQSDEHNPFFSELSRYNWVQTPNMKRLAEQGVIFENCYCPSPLCMPSRSAFKSGLYVHQIQRYSNANTFEHTYPCYGRLLHEQGVHSVHIGKTDVYTKTANLGFSEFYHPMDRPGPGDIYIRRKPLHIREDGAGRADLFGVKEKPHGGDPYYIDTAIDWLKNKAGSIDRPWTLEVNIGAPHFPHFVTQELWDRYKNYEDLPQYGQEVESAQHPFAQDLRNHFQTEGFTEQQIRGLRRGYYGRVSYVDQELGRILDTLEACGLRENTIVAYTSDHGEMLGKFGMWWKCSLYEDSARVPLIVSGPGFTGGKKVQTPVTSLDLQASLFKASATDRPEEWAGSPLQDIPEQDPDRVAFSEYHGHGTHASGYLIRKGDWKLLYNCEASHQLFNLAEDPDELNNLFGKNPSKARELVEELYGICDPELENQRANEMIALQLEAIANWKG